MLPINHYCCCCYNYYCCCYYFFTIQSPDTDVVMLSIAQFENLCCKELCFGTGGKDKQKFIPVHICETLPSPASRDENDFYKLCCIMYNPLRCSARSNLRMK